MTTYLFPASIYLLKVNNRNTRTRCEICSKLTVKTPERCQWHHSDIFIVNFEHISHLVLVFLLLTLNMQLLVGFAKHQKSSNPAVVDWLSNKAQFFRQHLAINVFFLVVSILIPSSKYSDVTLVNIFSPLVLSNVRLRPGDTSATICFILKI